MYTGAGMRVLKKVPADATSESGLRRMMKERNITSGRMVRTQREIVGTNERL
jgi:hypothetical protein